MEVYSNTAADASPDPDSVETEPISREEATRALKSLANALVIERAVARALRSHVAGVMARQLFYWEDKKHMAADYWVFKSGPEWLDEAGLTRYNVNTATARLEKAGLLEVDRGRLRPTDRRPCSFYRLNVWEVMRVVVTDEWERVEAKLARELREDRREKLQRELRRLERVIRDYELDFLEDPEGELVTDSNQPSTTLTQYAGTPHTSVLDSNTLACGNPTGEHVGTQRTSEEYPRSTSLEDSADVPCSPGAGSPVSGSPRAREDQEVTFFCEDEEEPLPDEPEPLPSGDNDIHAGDHHPPEEITEEVVEPSPGDHGTSAATPEPEALREPEPPDHEARLPDPEPPPSLQDSPEAAEMWRIVHEVQRHNPNATVGEFLDVIEPAMQLNREVAGDYLYRVLRAARAA